MVGKRGKRPSERPRQSLEDYTIISQATGCKGVNWIELAQDIVHWWDFMNIDSILTGNILTA